MRIQSILRILLLFGVSLVDGVAQPLITRQPSSQSVSLGADVTFTARATGTAPASFQWRFNDISLVGATLPNLNLTNVQTSQAGTYAVVVSNLDGSVTSDPALLTVDPTFTRITSGDLVTRVGSSRAVAWGDYDGDGQLDLYIAHAGMNHEGILYRNTGDGNLVPELSGATAIEQRGDGCAWADFDNDGHLDLFAGAWNRTSMLYRNDAAGDFSRIQFETAQRTTAIAWGDYDNDGYLDLYMANGGAEQWVTPLQDFLYRNRGDGTFVKMQASSVGEIADIRASSQAAAWVDYDSDGYLDLFVAIHGQNNFLYRNTGTGSFERITAGDIVNDGGASNGAAWGDFDNDGHLDLFVPNSAGQNNFLYHSNGDGTFTRILEGPVVSDGGRSHGAAWGDFDNDGHLDLYVANGGMQKNFLYRNNGDGTFTRWTEGSLVNETASSWGCAWGDYSNNGFLDLFVTNGALEGDQPNALYRNNGNDNGWFRVRCVGTHSNRSGIGTKVRLKATIGARTFWQSRQITSGDGQNGNMLDAHFGLGDATTVEVLRIEWPSGAVQELHGVAPRQLLTVTEPAHLEPVQPGQLRVHSWFGQSFLIEASTDLSQWTSLGTITNEAGGLSFSDPDDPSLPRRFYRAVQPQD